MNKKVVIGIIIVLFVAILTGALIYIFKSEDSKIFSSGSNGNKGKIVDINHEEFVDLVESNEKFAIIFTQSGCGHCKKMLEVLDEVISKNDVKIYNYDIKKVDEEEAEYIREVSGLKTVPLMVFFDKGSIIEEYKISGVKDYDEVVEKLEKVSLIGNKKSDDNKKDKDKNDNESQFNDIDTQIKNELEKIGKKWYEEYYYVALTEGEAPKGKEFLDKFKEIGLKCDLENLLKVYENGLDYTKEFCDLEKTKIIIYPKKPYGKTDYKLELELECK